jgi:hypothetical protein
MLQDDVELCHYFECGLRTTNHGGGVIHVRHDGPPLTAALPSTAEEPAGRFEPFGPARSAGLRAPGGARASSCRRRDSRGGGVPLPSICAQPIASECRAIKADVVNLPELSHQRIRVLLATNGPDRSAGGQPRTGREGPDGELVGTVSRSSVRLTSIFDAFEMARNGQDERRLKMAKE